MSTVGCFTSGGSIENASRSTVGYADDCNRSRLNQIAVYWFFSLERESTPAAAGVEPVMNCWA